MPSCRFLPFLLLLLPLCSCELLQLVSMFRHGARYHLSTAYDGNQTRQDWGQLTSVGMRQHHNLGSLLRKQYISDLGFLKAKYNHSEVKVYSTSVDRTISSAVAQLTGMFPQSSGERLPAGLSGSLQVPPYRYNDNVESEYALPSGIDLLPVQLHGAIFPCSNISVEIGENMRREHAAIEEMNTRYSPFFSKVNQIFNTSVDLTSFNNLVDSLTVDRYLKRFVPASLTDDDYTNLIHLQDYFGFLVLAGNLSKAISTSKLTKVLELFDSCLSKPSLQKLTMLSGHDTDLFPMILSLNLSSHTCVEEMYRFNKTNALNCEKGPEYAASIIWELHREAAGDDGAEQNGLNTATEYYVKIKSNGKYMYLCEKKDTRCVYSDWKARIVRNVIVDPTEFCPPPKSPAA